MKQLTRDDFRIIRNDTYNHTWFNIEQKHYRRILFFKYSVWERVSDWHGLPLTFSCTEDCESRIAYEIFGLKKRIIQ